MSANNGSHMSASQRKIAAMEQHIAGLEAMKKEYMALMNYLIYTSGGRFEIYKDKMQAMFKGHHEQLRVVKTEFIDPTGDMILTYGDEPPKEPSPIISLS